MADYYDIEDRGDGSFRVTPQDNPGCGSVIAFFIFILIAGFLVTHCDNTSSDSSVGNNTGSSQIQPTDSAQTVDEAFDYIEVTTVEEPAYYWISELSPINEESLCCRDFYDTKSNIGTELKHCLRTGTMFHGGSGEGWIEYYIDGKYLSLTGCLAITEEFYDTKFTGNLIIYADGAEIFRIDEMVAGDIPIDFMLDISGVKRIRFEHKGGDPFRVANLRFWTQQPS